MTDHQKTMRNIVVAADRIEEWLGKNSGTTKDWPVDIRCDNETDANKITDLLTKLHEALKPWRNKNNEMDPG